VGRTVLRDIALIQEGERVKVGQIELITPLVDMAKTDRLFQLGGNKIKIGRTYQIISGNDDLDEFPAKW